MRHLTITTENMNWLENAGASLRNKLEVKGMVDDGERTPDGKLIITDRENNRMLIDTVKGKISRLDENGKAKEYGTNNSKKENGYLYITIYVYVGYGETEAIRFGIHSIIGMAAYPNQFEDILALGKTPIANHINNVPWDNRAENLEWTTTGWNNTHGKIVSSLFHHYGFKHIDIANNKSDRDFMKLKNPISVAQIQRYVQFTGNNREFKVKNNGYIAKETLDRFIQYLNKRTSTASSTASSKAVQTII